jgi:hypothetical protein
MTHNAISRATWRINSPSAFILKCCIKDGSDVLATIEKFHHFKWQWSAQFQTGFAKTRHAAMRRARKALR